MKFLLITFLTLFIFTACATIPPEVQTLTAQTTGYAVAREFPHEAPFIIKSINLFLEETDDWLSIQDFHRWTVYILDIVKLDPYVKPLVLTLLAAIEIDLSGLDKYKPQAHLLRSSLTDFLTGMEMANP